MPLLKRYFLYIVKPEFLLLLGMFVMTLCVYAYYVFISPDVMGVTHYHGFLGDAFLSGHTYLNITPDPRLFLLSDPFNYVENESFRLHDASLYQGKYYLYFGPIPALLIWVPVKLLTGIDLADEVLAFIFTSIGTFCLFLLIYFIATQLKTGRRWGHLLGLVCTLSVIGAGTWLPSLLRRGHFYEVSIAGAYCFLAMGILFLWIFLQNRKKYFWLGLASLCFGLSIGCRLSYLISGIFLLLTLIYIFRNSINRSIVIASFIWMAVPMTICLGGLGYYNYVRFNSPFDSGWKYQLAIYKQADPDFHLYVVETVGLHAYKYLLKPLTWSTTGEFPFFSTVRDWGYYPSPETEPVYGLFTNHPFAVFFLLFLCDRSRWKRGTQETRFIGLSLTLYGSMQLLSISMFFFSTLRYSVDFSPWIMGVAGIYYLHLLKRYEQSRYYIFLLAVGGILAAYTVFTGTMFAHCGAARAC